MVEEKIAADTASAYNIDTENFLKILLNQPEIRLYLPFSLRTNQGPSPIKLLEHRDSMALRGLRGVLNRLPIYDVIFFLRGRR